MQQAFDFLKKLLTGWRFFVILARWRAQPLKRWRSAALWRIFSARAFLAR
jgi:hypothetical protein